MAHPGPSKGSPLSSDQVSALLLLGTLAILIITFTPLLAYNVDGANIGRARIDTTIIATAMTDFYRDTGRWPDRSGPIGADGPPLRLLVSGNPATPGTAPGDSGGWRADPHLTDVGFLADHLIHNRLAGRDAYPTDGERAWRGPYLMGTPLDPWGRPYLVNIAATRSGHPARLALVLSAGPNGRIDTPWATTGLTHPGGDDIGAPFFLLTGR